MRGKGLWIMVSFLLISCLLTACGGRDTRPGRDGRAVFGEAVSEEAVSGEAVSGEAVSVEEESGQRKKYPCCNDDSYYIVDKAAGLSQYRLDGTKVDMVVPKEVKDGKLRLWWVDNEWMYYSLIGDNDKWEELWRAPIRKQADGDRVLWEKRERLFRKTDFSMNEDGFYAGENFITYSGSTTDSANYYRFDLKTREETPMWEKGVGSDFYGCLGTEDYISAFEQGIAVFLDSDHDDMDSLYVLDLKKWKAREIYDCRTYYCDTGWGTLYDGEAILFIPDSFDWCGEEVWRCPGDAEQASCLISWERFMQEVEKVDPWGIAKERFDIDLCGMYLYRGRLYLDVGVEGTGEEEKDGKKVKVLYNGNLMFSCRAEDASDFRYEEEITRCLEADYSLEKWDGVGGGWDYMRTKSDYTFALLGKDLYIDVSDAKGKMKIRCYDMETGEIKILHKGDKESRALLMAGYECPEK